jgi:hypothetical protein
MTAKNVECACASRFTCGYCLRNTKPYHYTLADGSVMYSPNPAKFEGHVADGGTEQGYAIYSNVALS